MNKLEKCKNIWGDVPVKERIANTLKNMKSDYVAAGYDPKLATWELAKQLYNELAEAESWSNDTYSVWVYRGKQVDQFVKDKSWKGHIDYMSVKRIDKKPIHDWRDLQDMKNELFGKDREAIEIYPAEDRLVDLANQYHLWVMPKGFTIPVGFEARCVDPNESIFSGEEYKKGQRAKN